jgi:hypothetical protein
MGLAIFRVGALLCAYKHWQSLKALPAHAHTRHTAASSVTCTCELGCFSYSLLSFVHMRVICVFFLHSKPFALARKYYLEIEEHGGAEGAPAS